MSPTGTVLLAMAVSVVVMLLAGGTLPASLAGISTIKRTPKK